MDSIYTFFNGFKLDLNHILAIGPLEKNNFSQLFIPIYCKGYNKPIEIILGYSIGITDQEQKNKINNQFSDFLYYYNEFNHFKNETNDKQQPQTNSFKCNQIGN